MWTFTSPNVYQWYFYELKGGLYNCKQTAEKFQKHFLHDKYFCIHVYLDTDAINWNERPKGTISSTGGLKASSNTCKLHGKRC